MAYDERLAARIRSILRTESECVERRMFGGLAFMVGGRMCCGIVGSDLMVRLGPDASEHALSRRYVRAMNFTGRPMVGMVYVGPQGLSDTRTLRTWLDQALQFVHTLSPQSPPKRPHSIRKRARLAGDNDSRS